MGLVWFGLKKCSSVRRLQLITTHVTVEKLIYSITAMLNELCILDFDTVVNCNNHTQQQVSNVIAF